MSKAREEQYVRFTCDRCQKVCGANMSHYDFVSCGKCGKLYWALQPKRNGPLIAFPRHEPHA